METLYLPRPRFTPPLDPDFRPAVLAVRAFDAEVAAVGGGVPLALGLERSDGELSRFETRVFPAGHPRFAANFQHVERIVKFLLWQRGGWRVYVGGPRAIGEYLQAHYAADGPRAFDYHFMGREVYERVFEVASCAVEEVPAAHEGGQSLGRHLDGCRIGFDLGASDRKVSAVVDGEAVFSEEIIWEPRKHADPAYHNAEIMAGLRSAAARLPRVDAIGGSSAGIIIHNRPMVASLFRAVPQERYGEIRSLFRRIRDEWGVPLEVINDGDVTALAGAMSLEEDGVLGIALGSSQAAGYVTPTGMVTGWLNELAFAPVDYSPTAPADEWSGDLGVGGLYFSQQAVFRLAPRVGIAIPQDMTDADKLKGVQARLEAGHAGAAQIWQSIGVYLGYGIAHYAAFYELKHLLILGRVTSGRGGQIILDAAQEVIGGEFPELAGIRLHLPDEKSRRVGQSIAAASLPATDFAHNCSGVIKKQPPPDS